MLVIILAVFASVFVIFVGRRADKNKPPPTWLRKVSGQIDRNLKGKRNTQLMVQVSLHIKVKGNGSKISVKFGQ